MKQIEANKYNIAWFKLAECISRREKERALGVYRLLSHSFDNAAIVHQLEGDIMLAFNEQERAVEKYAQAAQLYEQQDQPMQAIAVYDHIITLVDCSASVEKMIDLYAQLNDHQRMFKYIKRFCHHLLKKQEMVQLLSILQKFNLNLAQKGGLLVELTLASLHDTNINRQIKLQLIGQTIERLMHDRHVLQQFLAKLKAVDEMAYKHACACVQE